MKAWPVQDAKARFSELLRATREDGPQMITMRGEETAVVLPMSQWRRLAAKNSAHPLLDAEPTFDFDIAPRIPWGRMRSPPGVDDE